MSTVHLSLEDIRLSFGGLKALRGVSVEIKEGELFAIIGPNGSGKSSLLNVISGIYVPDSGTIKLRGEKVPSMRPHYAARLGIARAFQNIALFQGMSVLDNVLTGRTIHMRSGFFARTFSMPSAKREESAHRRKCEEILAFLNLQAYRRSVVARLPYGVQKRVEMARALAAEPSLLLLDEPMAGMNQEEKEDMSRTVLDVNQELGVTVVLIEHDMGVVMDLCERVVVLDYGEKIADGEPDEVRANADVIRAYLGGGEDA